MIAASTNWSKIKWTETESFVQIVFKFDVVLADSHLQYIFQILHTVQDVYL